ncbi:MAG: hypothetical protein IPM66_25010 [Acidobacteriota bacterium]|nr:MAG: hypothetical protein IPM66_25010 [Acidobacteriota bacterium]
MSIPKLPVLLLIFSFFLINVDDIKISDSEAATLNKLTAHLDHKPKGEDLVFVESHVQSESTVIRCLAAIVLYKWNQKKYKEMIYDLYAVHDYVERSQNKYNIVDAKELFSGQQPIESRYPQITDKRLYFLIMFLQERDQNKWVDIRGEKISMARFFRAGFMASAFQGTNINPISLMEGIDKQTKKIDLDNLKKDKTSNQ